MDLNYGDGVVVRWMVEVDDFLGGGVRRKAGNKGVLLACRIACGAWK